MRKKQANIYFPDKKYKEPPYLTKEQIKDFESQFTLFNREINLSKLKQAMVNQNYHHSCKPVFNFIDKVSQQNKSISFNRYLSEMTENLIQLNQGQLIAQILDEQNRGQISKQAIKQMLQEALGREILPQQMNDIMVKVFDTKAQKIPTELLRKVINEKNQNFKSN